MCVKKLMGHKFYTLRNGWKIFEHRDGFLFTLKRHPGREKIIAPFMAQNLIKVFC